MHILQSYVTHIHVFLDLVPEDFKKELVDEKEIITLEQIPPSIPFNINKVLFAEKKSFPYYIISRKGKPSEEYLIWSPKQHEKFLNENSDTFINYIIQQEVTLRYFPRKKKFVETYRPR